MSGSWGGWSSVAIALAQVSIDLSLSTDIAVWMGGILLCGRKLVDLALRIVAVGGLATKDISPFGDCSTKATVASHLREFSR